MKTKKERPAVTNRTVKAFVKLMLKYEGMTLEKIMRKSHSKDELREGAAHYLTGFGQYDTCMLCKAVGKRDWYGKCGSCVWNVAAKMPDSKMEYACRAGMAGRTYVAIDNADTPKRLLTAFRKRAAKMRETLAKLGIDYAEVEAKLRAKE